MTAFQKKIEHRLKKLYPAKKVESVYIAGSILRVALLTPITGFSNMSWAIVVDISPFMELEDFDSLMEYIVALVEVEKRKQGEKI